ncbi:zinc ribbon domain-containing protein [Nocardioides sp.]|uniref:zinc ribbon domain-containing protein n=1 Tax=Nocardioides sp. TaxID=35761 RepID=UPI00261BD011|nr:zinc ribbon domain-containing protein [Nocardioides sp.]MDI6912481.1 OB-fold domain-containing protein [Nocardioides sp.]
MSSVNGGRDTVSTSWGSSAGLSGLGWYVPRLRLASKQWQKAWPGVSTDGGVTVAVPDSDEDVVTMAVEAADGALADAGISIDDVDEIYLASASGPYTTKSSAAMVGAGLGADRARTVDFGGSTRSIGDALTAALDAVAHGRVRRVLVIGSDFLPATPGDTLETRFGGAAGAAVVDAEARLLQARAAGSVLSTATTHWRCSGAKFVQRYDDPRLEREGSVVPNLVRSAASILEPEDLFVLPGTAAKFERLIAKESGHPRVSAQARTLAGVIGDTGNAHSLVALAEALSEAPTSVVVGFEGSGAGASAIRFTVPEAADLSRRQAVLPAVSDGALIDYVTFLKATGKLAPSDTSGPASPYSASPGWMRDERHLLAPTGALCSACGSLNYPPRSICIDCRGSDLTEVLLPRTGTVLTYNVQHIVPISPEEAPVAVCVAQMEGGRADGYGGKVTALMLREAAEDVRIGSEVRLIFRRAGVEHGMVRYGYKFGLRESSS